MSEWQPIETAPTWVEVIVFVPTLAATKSRLERPGVCTSVQVLLGQWELGSAKMFNKHKPTHWMPLPAPPESGK